MKRNRIKVLIGRIIDWIKALKREPICSFKISEELAENKIFISLKKWSMADAPKVKAHEYQ
jgi:hypothetical protein